MPQVARSYALLSLVSPKHGSHIVRPVCAAGTGPGLFGVHDAPVMAPLHLFCDRLILIVTAQPYIVRSCHVAGMLPGPIVVYVMPGPIEEWKCSIGTLLPKAHLEDGDG